MAWSALPLARLLSLLLLHLLALLRPSQGHASTSYFTCSRSLAVGQSIMSYAAISSTARTVVVQRSGTALTSGSSTYVSGETLQVSLSSTVGEYILESNQAIFTTGSCDKKRIYKSNSVTATSWSVTMPTDGCTVTIFAGFAASQSTVSITSTASFAAASTPSVAPTSLARTPSAAPSSAKPTVPISSSTVAQTLLTYSLEVQLANITKTSAVSNKQTLLSAMSSSYSSFYKPYNATIKSIRNATEEGRRSLLDSSTKISVDFSLQFILEATTYATSGEFTGALGVVSDLVMSGGILTSTLDSSGIRALAGVTSAALVYQALSSEIVYGTYAPTDAPTLAPALLSSYEPQDDSALRSAVVVAIVVSTVISAVAIFLCRKKKDVVMLITFTHAVVLAVLAIALTNLWAADKNNGLDNGFLGTPTGDNLFAYHPQIMISCFFFFQILAISSWSVFPVYLISKISHVAFNTAALISMAYGLYIIVKACIKNDSPGFVTLHSWIGVLCAIVFSLNYLYGMSMGVAKIFSSRQKDKDSKGLSSSMLRFVARFGPHIKLVHKLMGAIALALSLLSIVTGIVLKMNGCAYISSSAQLSITEEMNTKPEEYYQSLPLSCKISGGVGVAVTISAAFVLLLAIYRNVPTETYFPVEIEIQTDRSAADEPSAGRLYPL